MNVNGKLNVFKNVVVKDEKEIITYNTSISREIEGKRVNYRLEVQFAKNNFSEATLNKLEVNKCYVLNVEEGFLSFNQKGDKKYFFVKIMKASILDVKECKPVEVDSKELPF